jgi:3-oxoadipate enol-lactonase
MWQPQVIDLSDRWRLIPVDHRGHGGSPVPRGPYSIEELAGDVLAALDHRGVERVSFCGLSLGGMVGMWLAANAPERIERLVLICTAAHLPPPSLWLKRAAIVRRRGVEALADAVVEAWFTPEADPTLSAEYRAMVTGTPAEAYAGCCEAIAQLDLRGDLARIEAPTLVIAGAQDTAAPPGYGREIAEGIRGARYQHLEPGAHLASVERAHEVSDLIAAHLAR